MRPVLLIAVLTAAFVLAQQRAAGAQEGRPDAIAGATTSEPAAGNMGAADGAMSLELTGERRPLYRLRKSDVIQITFTFSHEFDQEVTVQPDGFVVLQGKGEMWVEGKTLSEVREVVRQAYSSSLHDPEVSVRLKDFDKPYFLASGEVGHPGKYELRADTTVTEGIAMAGGFTPQAKHSQVVLFRRVSEQFAEARVLNIKRLLKNRDLKEDVRLRSGDLVFVPQNRISKLQHYIPIPTLGMYYNPGLLR
jgi:polysaccharide export outer membrane protein